MNLSDIQKIDKEYLTATDIAPLLECNPQDIRTQAQNDPTKLGFPVIVTGTRVRIPKNGFIFFMIYGRPTPETIKFQAQEKD